MLSYNATPFCPSSSFSSSSAFPPSPTGSNSSLPSSSSSSDYSTTTTKKPLIQFLQIRTHRRVSSMDSSTSPTTNSSFAVGVQDLPTSTRMVVEEEEEGGDGYWSEICREVGI
ncbi:hypothetical protein BDY24DRAFT_418968 [Mrakia frigida]|uniref:uncharacterized protein n=1 Tax=Mrakia frigida TaxID=29902 RepID=UPI003FCC1229